MTTSKIVAFHIGRGGRFNNAGHLSFCGENTIGRYVDDLFLTPENANEVGQVIGDRENLRAKFEDACACDPGAIAFFEKIGLPVGEMIYTDCNGSPVGLSLKQEQTGIGRINIDGDYDTTYTCLLSDIDEDEAEAILEYSGYIDSVIVDYAKELLGIEEEEEEE